MTLLTGSSDTGINDWPLLGIDGQDTMVELLKVHQPCCLVCVKGMTSLCYQHFS